MLSAERPMHANTQHVQFPITLWCQNESSTLNRRGESASSLCCRPRLLWLPLPYWLRLSHLIQLLKKTCFLTLGTSRYVWRLGAVIFGYRLSSSSTLCCNQGTEPRLCFWQTLLLLLTRITSGLDQVHKNDCNYLISQTRDPHCTIWLPSSEIIQVNFKADAFLKWPYHMKAISSSRGREKVFSSESEAEVTGQCEAHIKGVQESRRKRPWQWFVPPHTHSQHFLLLLSITFRSFSLKASLFTQKP